MINAFKKSLSLFGTLGGLIVFLISVPSALAVAVLSFNNPPPEIFNTETQTKIDFQVRLNQVEQPTDIKFQVKPAGLNAFDVKTIEYTESGTNVFSWDGKYMGETMAPGPYVAFFSGNGLDPISTLFDVVSSQPTLSYTKDAPLQHVLGQGDYKVSVDLSKYASDTSVSAAVIISDSNLYIPQDEYIYQANGTHEFSWDVSDYEPGIYDVRISGEDESKNSTNDLDYELKILDPKDQPTLVFNNLPVTQFTLGTDDYEASVKLNNYTSDTLVTAHVVNLDSAVDKSVDNFTFTGLNEVHAFNIDIAGYKVGNYELRIFGEDEDKTKTNILIHKFKIVETSMPEPETEIPQEDEDEDVDSCAGYKDLKKTDWSCEAAIWAKEEGIITGQDDGQYLDGYSFLNRAEITKISLVAHKEYDSSVDYCDMKKPFYDVPLGQWYTNYICRGADISMVTGYKFGDAAGKFLSAHPVSVIEMFAILLRPIDENMPAGESFIGLQSNQWYSGYAKYVKDRAYYPGSSLNPYKEATRFEVLNFLYMLHKGGKFEL